MGGRYVIPVTSADLSDDDPHRNLFPWKDYDYFTSKDVPSEDIDFVLSKLCQRVTCPYPSAWHQPSDKYIICGFKRVWQLAPEITQNNLPVVNRVDAYDHFGRPLAIFALPVRRKSDGKVRIILDYVLVNEPWYDNPIHALRRAGNRYC
jgi:hypothetical protein